MLTDADGTAKRLDVVFLQPIYCPNRCGETILSRDLPAHLEELCPLRLAECVDGCGEVVHGKDLEAHRQQCPFLELFDRGEIAVREGAIKELRIIIADVYKERERAEARVRARGEEPRTEGGWVREICRKRARHLENESIALTQRLRFRARERLQIAVECHINYDDMDEAEEDGTAEKHVEEGTRPWDIEAPDLPPLIAALAEASVCGENRELRLRCERQLHRSCRRMLEAAMARRMDEEDKASVLADAVDRATQAVKVVELESSSALADMLGKAKEELDLLSLRNLPLCDPEFHEAVKKGDVELCSWLFARERANPSAVDPKTGMPALVVAAKAGDVPLCELLLQKHADIDARCAMDGCSALHWAAHLRYARVLDLLLRYNANPRLQDKRGLDALMKLLRRDIRAPAAGCSWTWQEKSGELLDGPCLLLSESEGIMTLDEAKELAEMKAKCVGLSVHGHDATLILTGQKGRVCLHQACPLVVAARSAAPSRHAARSRHPSRGSSRAQGSKPPPTASHQPSTDERRADSLAAPVASSLQQQLQQQQHLLPPSNGKEPPTDQGAAERATSKGAIDGMGRVASLIVPVAHGAAERAKSKGAVDGMGRVASLTVPVAHGNREAAVGRTSSKHPMLHWALPHGMLEGDHAVMQPPFLSFLKVATDPVHDLQMMLAAGADPLARDRSGLTALHHHLLSSPDRGSLCAVEVLLKAGADVNVRDDGPRATTPFLIAVTSRRADLVRLMISEAFPPADVDVRSSDGQSALALAEAAGSWEITKLLQNAGASIWADVECVIGVDTTLSFDTRRPKPVFFAGGS